MGRGDSLSRVLRLLKTIQDDGEVSASRLAQQFGTTVRTVYRDLILLQNAGAPLYSQSLGKHAHWKLTDDWRNNFRVSLSWMELVSLWTALQLLPNELDTLAQHGFAKLSAAVPKEMRVLLERFTNKVSALEIDNDSSEPTSVTQTLTSALDNQRTVQFLYQKPGQKKKKLRTVDPLHFHVEPIGLYLVGYCHDRSAIRTFLISRISVLKLTSNTFSPKQPIKPDDYFQGGFGAWEEKATLVQLRFDQQGADAIRRLKLHKTSQISDDGKHGLTLTLQVPLVPAVVRFVVGFGEHVEVLRPTVLRQKVTRAHLLAIKKSTSNRKKDKRVTSGDTTTC